MTNQQHAYRIGPFCYQTDLSIPELKLGPVDGCPVINVALGVIPEALLQPLINTKDCQAAIDEFLLRIPGVAGYYARNGREVTVQLEPGAPALDVRAYLLSSIFAALCHQRHLLPLHAGAVRTERGVVAFLGASGAGKSSLIAFLARRGYPVVCDDICLIDPAAPLERRVRPVAHWLKLWRSTMDVLGEQPDLRMRTFTEDDKYRVGLADDETPLPLAELIILRKMDLEENHDGESGLRRTIFRELTPAQAVQSMLQLTYQAWLVHGTGQTPAYFERCGKALGGVKAFSMERPWGFAAMDATLDALEEHLGSRKA
ncbi:MAG: hypothetical protein ACR2JE_09495 [Acidobacteriaceae bacterium]